MNFMKAVKAMKEGKRVRRNIWARTFNLHSEKHYGKYNIMDDDFKIAYPWDIEDFEANDWEISK